MARCAGSARPIHRSKRARAAMNSPSWKRQCPRHIASPQMRRRIVPSLAVSFRDARPATATICARLARDGTPIGPQPATPDPRVDRAVQPARALWRAFRPRPPPPGLSWQSVLAERYLQVQFLLPAPRAVRQTGKHLQPFPQLGDRFRHRRSRQRLLTGLQPIDNRLFHETGFRTVLRQQRGSGPWDLRKAVLESSDNTVVQLLAPAVQQRAVGRFLNQRVLEDVVESGGAPRTNTRPAIVSRSSASRSFGSARSVTDAINSKPNSRPIAAPVWAICLAWQSQPVEPRHQQGLQRARNCKRREEPSGAVSRIAFVISSINSGTPSVCAMMRSITACDSARPSAPAPQVPRSAADPTG